MLRRLAIRHVLPSIDSVILSPLLVVLFLLAFVLPSPSLAIRPGEEGMPFMQMFTLDETGGASQNWGVVQNKEGLIYVANLMAVLEYDGGRWRRIYHPSQLRPVSIDIDSTDRIYVGYQGDMGFLRMSSNGHQQVVSLRSQVPDSIADVGYIWGTKTSPQGVFFRSPNRLYRWRPSDQRVRYGEMKVWSFPPGHELLGLSVIEDHVYIWQQGRGLLEVKGDSLVVVPGGEGLKDIRVRSVSPFGEDTLLLTCETNGLYVLQDGRARPLRSEADDFARTNFAVGAIRTDNGMFALATRFGGLLIFNRDGKIQRYIDKSLGLLDNNILGTPYADRQGALWLPLNYGIGRVEAPSPLDYYDYDLGMDGIIDTIVRHKGRLYVGTSQGLYVLTPSSTPGRPGHFELVPGAEDRNWQLLSVRGKLLAISSKGIEEITGPNQPPKMVYPIRMAYCIDVSPDSSRLYLGTYNNGVHTFRYRGGDWHYEGPVTGTSKQILIVDVDQRGDLWLMANYRHVERVHFLPSTNGRVPEHTVTVYDTARGLPHLSHYFPLSMNNHFYLGNPAGLFRFQPESDSFVPDSTFGDGFGSGDRGIWNMVADDAGGVWFNTQYAKGARVKPTESGEYELTYPLLRTSQSDFQCFYPEENGGVVWAGAKNGSLVRYTEQFEHSDSTTFKALVRRVVVGTDSVLMDGGFPANWETPKLRYDLNAVRFEYTIPRYDAPHTRRFRYRLIGLNDEWSTWMDETYRNFNSLREGRYRFEVSGYDVYYEQSTIGSFEFIVLPPWYRTFWAYVLYVLFFAAFVYFLLKWRVRRIENQKRQLEDLVNVRTEELSHANDKIQQYNEQLETMLQERTRHLIRSERQAVFGQMVQGIVHNLRNPLTSSTMSTQLMRMAIEKARAKNFRTDDEELGVLREITSSVEAMVNWIEKANETLSNMINSLLTKSRSDKEKDMNTIDLNDLVKNELEFLQADRMFRVTVDKQIELTEETLPVNVVPGELAQVLQNLVRNALDAMFKVDKPILRIRTWVADGNKVKLSVTDNGSGIPENIQDRIFDPFFSTKPPEGAKDVEEEDEPRGTGLGLWMCQEAMHSFKGEIEVSSIQGRGTTFILTLPKGEDSARRKVVIGQ
ncbi:hypothetical protein KQI63_12565 [bacterium]|nr:hypothetical protein [bacterium]